MTTDPVPPVENPTTAVPADSAPAPKDPPPAVDAAMDGDNDSANVTPKDKGAEPSEAEKRIKKLVAQKKEEAAARVAVEKDAAYWRGVAEGRIPHPESGAQQQPQVQGRPPAVESPDAPPVAPVIANFEKFADYEAAKDDYLVKRAKWELRQETRTREEQLRVEKINRSWAEKVEKAQEKYEDFSEVVSNPAFIQTEQVAFLIKDSDMGGDLAYYLATHLDETRRINSLPPHKAAIEIGKLEVKLSAPKTEPRKIISQAPEPVTPVTPAPMTEVDEDKLPIDEFMKRRNARDAESRQKQGWAFS